MRNPRSTRRKWIGFMSLGFLGRSSILAKKCSCLTLISSLFPVNFDLDGIDLLLLLMFFPGVQLRLKMKLSVKSSKWTVTNSSFFMRAPKWRRNLWRTSLWSCQFYVMMCLEWHLRSFLPFSFVCCLFFLHFITCSHWGQCAFQVWGEGLEKLCMFSIFLFFVFCFLYFLLFYNFTVSVVIFGFVFCFSICVYICFLFLFSCILFCMFFCICMLVCFFVVVVFLFQVFWFVVFVLFCCFTIFTILHTEKIKILQLLFANVLVEFRHFLMFFIGFLTCINCERCTIF